MRPAAAVIVSACLLASGCLQGARMAPGGRSGDSLPQPWLELKTACSTSADGSQVCCGRDAFLESAQGAVDLWENATVCRARLNECRSHATTDNDVCLTQRAELQAKLDDPWRSPWLWGIIGLVAGGVLVGGLILAVP